MNRRERLKALIDERFNGQQAEFARAIRRPPTLVYQYLSGRRGIGEKFARHVERSLRLPKGWLDGEGDIEPGQVPAVFPLENQLTIPIYDVSAAAGAGAFVEGEQVADHLLVRADWLRELVGYLPSSGKVAIIQVRGDSMEPTLSPGDLILVERRTYTREELTDGIYVVRLEGALLVKRLQFVPGGIALISDNARYRDQVVSDVEVIAKVIYMWHGKRA